MHTSEDNVHNIHTNTKRRQGPARPGLEEHAKCRSGPQAMVTCVETGGGPRLNVQDGSLCAHRVELSMGPFIGGCASFPNNEFHLLFG